MVETPSISIVCVEGEGPGAGGAEDKEQGEIEEEEERSIQIQTQIREHMLNRLVASEAEISLRIRILYSKIVSRTYYVQILVTWLQIVKVYNYLVYTTRPDKYGRVFWYLLRITCPVYAIVHVYTG